MKEVFILFIAIIIAITCEVSIVDAVSSSGISGIPALLFMCVLPGSFIVYVLTNSAQ
jgi:hypothetical protein